MLRFPPKKTDKKFQHPYDYTEKKWSAQDGSPMPKSCSHCCSRPLLPFRLGGTTNSGFCFKMGVFANFWLFLLQLLVHMNWNVVICHNIFHQTSTQINGIAAMDKISRNWSHKNTEFTTKIQQLERFRPVPVHFDLISHNFSQYVTLNLELWKFSSQSFWVWKTRLTRITPKISLFSTFWALISWGNIQWGWSIQDNCQLLHWKMLGSSKNHFRLSSIFSFWNFLCWEGVLETGFCGLVNNLKLFLSWAQAPTPSQE